MKITSREVLDSVMTCLDDLRRDMRKSGADSNVFRDINTVENAMWEAIDNEPTRDMGFKTEMDKASKDLAAGYERLFSRPRADDGGNVG